MAAPRTRTKGTGSVRQLKSGRWQARYEENDKFRSLGTFDTKTAATNALAKVRVAKIDRTYRSPEQTRNTVGAYATEWLARRADDIDDGIKGSTLDLYRNLLKRWINSPLDNDGVPFTLGEFQLGALTPQVIQQWTNLIRKTIIRNLEERSRPSEAVAIRIWAKSKGIDVAPTGRISPSLREKWEAAGSPYPPLKVPPKTAGETTRRQAYRMLHQIMQDAWANEIISANPCRKNPKVTTRAKRPIASLDEVQSMTDAAPDEYAAAVQLAALGGLRDGEIKALRRNDITILHDDAGQVSGALVRVDERNYRGDFDTPKTEAGARMVRLAPAPARYLAGHLGLFAPDGDAETLIFEQTKNWHTWWKKARAAAGRPDIRFHDLRHTFASVAIGNGADPTAVQAVLGHATASMTQHYTHAVGDPAARVADTMARVLGEAAGSIDRLR